MDTPNDLQSPRTIWLWVKTNGTYFGVGAPPVLVYFSGDWDVHWGLADLDFDPWPCVSFPGQRRVGGPALLARHLPLPQRRAHELVGREAQSSGKGTGRGHSPGTF